jgi:hypothetical protein
MLQVQKTKHKFCHRDIQSSCSLLEDLLQKPTTTKGKASPAMPTHSFTSRSIYGGKWREFGFLRGWLAVELLIREKASLLLDGKREKEGEQGLQNCRLKRANCVLDVEV